MLTKQYLLPISHTVPLGAPIVFIALNLNGAQHSTPGRCVQVAVLVLGLIGFPLRERLEVQRIEGKAFLVEFLVSAPGLVGV